MDSFNTTPSHLDEVSINMISSNTFKTARTELRSIWVLIRQKFFKFFRAQKLLGDDRLILNALEREGIFITNLNDLRIPGSDYACDLAMRAFEMHRVDENIRFNKSYIDRLSESILLEHKEILMLGLNDRLLAIIENYIGKPVFYRGVVARRDYADGQNIETRLFHLDSEDDRIIKIIIYLNDVGVEDGPFQYVPRRFSPEIQSLVFTNGRVLDENMAMNVPSSNWHACTGSAGTVIFVDTARLFHRGMEPKDRDRYALFYAYNSTTPLSKSMSGPIQRCTEILDLECLSSKQIAAIIEI
jgi:hypothetical protein